MDAISSQEGGFVPVIRLYQRDLALTTVQGIIRDIKDVVAEELDCPEMATTPQSVRVLLSQDDGGDQDRNFHVFLDLEATPTPSRRLNWPQRIQRVRKRLKERFPGLELELWAKLCENAVWETT